MDIVTYAVLKKRIQESKLTPQEKQEIIDEAVSQIVGVDTPENLDTLKEIADWIAADETGTAQIIADIKALQKDKISVAFVNVPPANPEPNTIYAIKNDNGNYIEYIYNEDLGSIIPLNKDFTDMIDAIQNSLTDYAKHDDFKEVTDADIDALFN